MARRQFNSEVIGKRIISEDELDLGVKLGSDLWIFSCTYEVLKRYRDTRDANHLIVDEMEVLTFIFVRKA